MGRPRAVLSGREKEATVKRWLVLVALLLGLVVPVKPASAGSTTFSTTDGCQAAAEAASWYARTTMVWPSSSRCAYVRVRLVYKSKVTGSILYGAWKYAYPDLSGSTVAVATLDTSNYVLLKAHHVAEDVIGFVTQRTCFPGQTTCANGLVYEPTRGDPP